MSPAKQQPDFDLDEDLFDFADVAREPEPGETEEDLDEIFASFRDESPAEELLAVPSVPSVPSTSPAIEAGAPGTTVPRSTELGSEPRATEPVRPEPMRAAPVASVKGAPLSVAAARPDPVRELAAPVRPSRFSKGLVAVALSVTALNSLLAVVVLRGNANDVSSAHAVPPDDHARDAHAAPPQAASRTLPDPDAVPVAHGHPTLDEARAQVSRGEYGAARQRVYALLAIIDRLEDPRRAAIEADCQFLIAQSLHLEALARMGGSR